MSTIKHVAQGTKAFLKQNDHLAGTILFWIPGPGHISIFGPIIDDLPPISEDAVVKCQNVLNETRLLLTDTVRRPTNDDTCVLGQNSSRRKELATVMGSLLEEIAKAETVPVDENIENTSILGTLGTAKGES